VVFSEEATKHFPPSHPEDHIINLREDAPPTINCKTYKLMIDERNIKMYMRYKEPWEY
jgi:hypothetical protein